MNTSGVLKIGHMPPPFHFRLCPSPRANRARTSLAHLHRAAKDPREGVPRPSATGVLGCITRMSIILMILSTEVSQNNANNWTSVPLNLPTTRSLEGGGKTGKRKTRATGREAAGACGSSVWDCNICFPPERKGGRFRPAAEAVFAGSLYLLPARACGHLQ